MTRVPASKSIWHSARPGAREPINVPTQGCFTLHDPPYGQHRLPVKAQTVKLDQKTEASVAPRRTFFMKFMKLSSMPL
jgi:hypothetical protein